jgi:hypothetical protein
MPPQAYDLRLRAAAAAAAADDEREPSPEALPAPTRQPLAPVACPNGKPGPLPAQPGAGSAAAGGDGGAPPCNAPEATADGSGGGGVAPAGSARTSSHVVSASEGGNPAEAPRGGSGGAGRGAAAAHAPAGAPHAPGGAAAPAAAPQLQLPPPPTGAATPAVLVPPSAAPAPQPLEPAETPIANLAVRLFHDPPTTGQRTAHERRCSSMGAPPSVPRQQQGPSPAPAQQQQQQPTGMPGPWISRRRRPQGQAPAAAGGTAAAAQQERGGAARPAPQLHLTRSAAPCTWDAQSQAGDPDAAGWGGHAPALGWARLESQCGATWSPPPPARGGVVADAAGPSACGAPAEAGAGGGGRGQQAGFDRLQQQDAQQGRWRQQGPLQGAQGPVDGSEPQVIGGTQLPPGWDDTQPLAGAPDEDADVVPPTPIRTGDAAEALAASAGATGAAAASAGRRRLLSPAVRSSPRLRKRRLPSLNGGDTPAAATQLLAGAAQGPGSGGGSRGRPAAGKDAAAAASPRRSQHALASAQPAGSGSGGAFHGWQARSMPAAGPTAYATVPLTPEPAEAPARQQQPEQTQLRLQLGAAVRHLLPGGDGLCGVLLERAAATPARSGSRTRGTPRAGAGAGAYTLLLIQLARAMQQRGTANAEQVAASLAQRRAAEGTSLRAWGTWQVGAAAACGSGSEAGAANAMQLLHWQRGGSGGGVAGRMEAALMALPGVTLGDAPQRKGARSGGGGVNVWLLASGGGGGGGGGGGAVGGGGGHADAALLQELATPERMRCVAVGGGSWVAAAGDGGCAYVWPRADTGAAAEAAGEAAQQEQQQQKQQQRGWVRRGQLGSEGDAFFEAPTAQQRRDAAAEPVDAARRGALPAATLRGMPFTEVSELCFLAPGGEAAGGAGWLLAGCSSEGALALWDAARRQLLVTAFPSLGGLSCLMPLPRPAAAPGAGPAPALPLALLACVPDAGGASPMKGPSPAAGAAAAAAMPVAAAAGQRLAHVVLHPGGAALGAPLPLHMPVAAAAARGRLAAAAAPGGDLIAWDVLEGTCLLRGALPAAGRGGGGGGGRSGGAAASGAAAAAVARGGARVGFLADGVLMVGTPEGALHVVAL